jgi:hypothetical protein
MKSSSNFPNLTRLAALALLVVLLSPLAQARVSIQLFLGEYDIPVGTVGILVADRAGDGVASPTHITAAGTVLEKGATLGLTDDLILGVFQAQSNGFDIDQGFLGVISNLDYEELGLTPGHKMAFFWFTDHLTPGGQIQENEMFDSFQSVETGDAPLPYPLLVPPDRGVYTIAYTDGVGDGVHLADRIGLNRSHLNTNGRIETPMNIALEPVAIDEVYGETARGGYDGLIHGPGLSILGAINLRVSRGMVSGRLVYDGARLRFRGEFDAAGLFSGQIARRGAPPLLVDLQLGKTANGYRVTGTISDGTDTHQIDVAQRVFSTKDPTPFQGSYTMLLPAPSGVDTRVIPGGNGVATVKVSAQGRVRARATLGDGERVSLLGAVGPEGVWGLYKQLYRSSGNGALAGAISFRMVDNVSSFDGSLAWNKGAHPRPSPRRVYPAGFSLQVTAVGDLYRAPYRASGEIALNALSPTLENAKLDFQEGGLNPPVADQILTWSDKNRIAFVDLADGERMRMTVSVKDGSVSGFYENRNIEPRPRIRFKGIIINRQGLVAGNFVNGPQSGAFYVEPAEEPALVVEVASGGALNSGDIVDFGDAGTDGGFAELDIRLTNAGQGRLLIPSSPILNSTTGHFGLVTSRGGYLNQGESSLLRVRFQPTIPGADSAMLTVETNDRNNNPFLINLNGSGIAGTGGAGIGHAGDVHLDQPGLPFSAQATTPVAIFLAGTHAGKYYGLITEAGQAVPEIAGAGNFQVRDTGAASGTLLLHGNRFRLRGIIDTTGTFVGTLTGRGSEDYTLDALQLEQTAAGDVFLTGTLNTGAYDVRLGMLPYHRRDNPSDLDGAYTLIMPADNGLGTGYPSGDGSGAVTIDEGGRVNAKLLLADGVKVTLSATLGGGGELQIFKQVYRSSPEGVLSGVLHFRDEPNVSDFDGRLSWNRPLDPRAALFPFGFRQTIGTVGSQFVAVDGQQVLDLVGAGPNAELTLIGAGLGLGTPSIGPLDLLWDTSNRTSYVQVRSERLDLRVNKRNGLISGRYSDRETNVSAKIGGVVFQKQNIATGIYTTRRPANVGFMQLVPK